MIFIVIYSLNSLADQAEDLFERLMWTDSSPNWTDQRGMDRIQINLDRFHNLWTDPYRMWLDSVKRWTNLITEPK